MTRTLLRGHEAFRARYAADERDYLRRLASEGQRPSALYVGCCDSRVVPELLTGSAPGELFVVRNIANLVPPLENADASVGAALEYAVTHLHVEHVIVCGHYGCGGVRAVIDRFEGVGPLPSLREWLEGARPAVERARALGLDDATLFRRAVEENVLDQLQNLLSFPQVALALDQRRLAIHGWVYDMYTQRLHLYDAASDRFAPADELPVP